MSTPELPPLRTHAALVCHTLGLGKSQIASLLGATRAALYDCLKGRGSLPQVDAWVRSGGANGGESTSEAV